GAGYRAGHFAAVLLLALPLIECTVGKPIQGRPVAEALLGDMAAGLEAARAGRVAAERLRDELAARAVPAGVADFVVRWRTGSSTWWRRIDGRSHLDDGEGGGGHGHGAAGRGHAGGGG